MKKITLLLILQIFFVQNVYAYTFDKTICTEEKCASVKCANPGIAPSGCSIIKRCCCEEVDCSDRGENLGRVYTTDLVLNELCRHETSTIMTDSFSEEQVKLNLENLNHCFINSDCGVLSGFSCCKGNYLLTNKNEDFCIVREEIEGLLSSTENNCKCENKLIPKPKDLRCINKKCTLNAELQALQKK